VLAVALASAWGCDELTSDPQPRGPTIELLSPTAGQTLRNVTTLELTATVTDCAEPYDVELRAGGNALARVAPDDEEECSADVCASLDVFAMLAAGSWWPLELRAIAQCGNGLRGETSVDLYVSPYEAVWPADSAPRQLVDLPEHGSTLLLTDAGIARLDPDEEVGAEIRQPTTGSRLWRVDDHLYFFAGCLGDLTCAAGQGSLFHLTLPALEPTATVLSLDCLPVAVTRGAAAGQIALWHGECGEPQVTLANFDLTGPLPVELPARVIAAGDEDAIGVGTEDGALVTLTLSAVGEVSQQVADADSSYAGARASIDADSRTAAVFTTAGEFLFVDLADAGVQPAARTGAEGDAKGLGFLPGASRAYLVTAESLEVFELADGSLIAAHDLSGEEVTGSLAITDGRVGVALSDGQLALFESQEGSEPDRIRLRPNEWQPTTAPIAASSDAVLLGVSQGASYAIRRSLSQPR